MKLEFHPPPTRSCSNGIYFSAHERALGSILLSNGTPQVMPRGPSG